MSRKPVDQQQPHECRQAIWEQIRLLVTFTVKEIALHVRLEEPSIRDYVRGLELAGYLTGVSASKRPGTPRQYTLVKDVGVDAPRVRKNGQPVTQGQGRRQMWNAMQVLKRFTPVELAFNASTEEHKVAELEAYTYCCHLCQAGYLASEGKSYMLIPGKWTGPHAPQIQRTKQVYDPNLAKVVWSRIEGGAE